MKNSAYNFGCNFEGIGTQFQSAVFESNIMRTEVQMQKMFSSPLIESLSRHESLVKSVVSSPALEAIQVQQNILNNLPSMTSAISAGLQTKSLVESAIRPLQEVPIYSFAESVTKSIESCNLQCIGLAQSMHKSVDIIQLDVMNNLVNNLSNSLSMVESSFVTVAQQAFQGMSEFVNSFQKSMSAITNVVRDIDFSPLLQFSTNLSYISDFDEKNEVLKNFGWYLIEELPEEIVDEIYNRRDEITQEEVDVLIVQHFRNDRCQALKTIVKSWTGLPYFESRKVVFHEAQVCHSRRYYNISTAQISLHYEGVVTDFVRDRVSTPTYKAKKALECINDLANDMTLDVMPYRNWLACMYVLEFVDEAFSSNFSPADPDSCPNTSRHKIAHGHATAKETEANSLRRFLFMNELYKLFRCLENEYKFAS